MVRNIFLARRQRRRAFAYRPAVWLLEDRSLPSFVGPATYAVPGGAGHLEVADFNGDGVPDLVAANSGSTVSILLGRGDGTLGDPARYDAGAGPGLVVVGDFNGDGIPDLAVTNFSYTDPGTVSILLGNGDGSFQPPHSYACGNRPYGLVAADFNGDGALDLAVANSDGGDPDYRGSVRVLVGNGDGSFGPPARYDAGVNPVTLVAADFNGDGVPDLAVGNRGLTTQAIGSSISVYTGVGDGAFRPPVDYAPGLNPQAVAVGDFNGDGLPDLVEGIYGTRTATVLLNQGDGSLQPTGTFAVDRDPSAIVVGDFNGDGLPDLAVSHNLAQTLSILPGNGDGTFGSPVSYAAGYVPGSLAAGDFNGDGALDLVLTNTLSNSVSVFLNRGDGTLLASVEMNPGTGPVVGGDFNGDGITDLVAPNYDRPGTISVLLGSGDGTFQPEVRYAVGPDPRAVAVGDFNGDGIADLAVANTNAPFNNGTVSILLGRGDGTFLPAVDYDVGAEPWVLVVADFNGDGAPDLAVGNYVGGTISILLGRGDGTFQPAVTAADHLFPIALAAGDFNGDGFADLVVVNQGSFPDYVSTLSVVLGNGDGTFQPAKTATAEVRSGPVAVADFNGDGIPDLAVGNYTAGTVGIWLGVGDGSFQPAVDYAASPYARFVAVADFNADGLPDLAVSGANTISILLGRGDGTFAPPLSYVGGYSPGPLVVGDVNGDGFPDLLAHNQGGLIALLNAADWGPGAPAARPGTGPIRARGLPPSSAPWWVVRLAIPAAADGPRALSPDSGTVRAPQSHPWPATGTTEADRTSLHQPVATSPVALPRRPVGNLDPLGCDRAVVDWLVGLEPAPPV